MSITGFPHKSFVDIFLLKFCVTENIHYSLHCSKSIFISLSDASLSREGWGKRGWYRKDLKVLVIKNISAKRLRRIREKRGEEKETNVK